MGVELFIGGFCALVACWLAWLVARLAIRYKAGQKSLRIMIAGFTIRRIWYEDIARLSFSMSRVGFFNTERWCNTARAATRYLVIHRKTGFLKRVLITPRYRDEFREELAEAIRRATGSAEFDTDSSPDTDVMRVRRKRGGGPAHG